MILPELQRPSATWLWPVTERDHLLLCGRALPPFGALAGEQRKLSMAAADVGDLGMRT
jgi:hypothetical protein